MFCLSTGPFEEKRRTQERDKIPCVGEPPQGRDPPVWALDPDCGVLFPVQPVAREKVSYIGWGRESSAVPDKPMLNEA